METEAERLDVDRETLTPVVRAALGSPAARVLEWRVERISYAGTTPLTLGIYRLGGEAVDGGGMRGWSVVLKVTRSPVHLPLYGALERALRPDEFAAGLAVWRWDREALAYRSGVLDALPGGLAAPRCYGVTERPGDVLWLWLEHLVDEHGGNWPLTRFGVAARHLGAFNGGFLEPRPRPRDPWLCRDLLRVWAGPPGQALSPAPIGAYADARTWQRPLVLRAFPTPVGERLLRLWDDRERFLGALDRLPATLCHGDAFRPNLFARRDAAGREQTVAIDWTYMGHGAVGEDAGQLFAASLLWHEADASRAAELDGAIFEGYLAGRRDAGWAGDARVARLGYAASAALHWGVIAPKPIVGDDDAARTAAERFGRSLEEMLRQRALTTYCLLDLADEARALMDAV